jgi:uncharacterized protein with beta-barrel porin domain
MQRNFLQLMPTGREIAKTGEQPRVANLWGTLTGGMKVRDSIDRYSGYEVSSTGFAVGYDRMITPNYLFGAAMGYDLAHMSFDSINSKAEMNAFRTMLYNSWYNGTWHVDAYGGYSKNFNETERNINFADFSAKSLGEYNDDVATVGFEWGRTSWFDQMFSITPSIGMHYVRVISPDVLETNGGDANLFVEGDAYQSLEMPIGVKASGVLTGEQGTQGIIWVPEARIFYVREWIDDEATAMTSFSGFRGTSFAATSGKRGKDSGLFGVGLNVQASEHWNLRFDYDFEVYRNTSSHTFGGTLGVNW